MPALPYPTVAWLRSQLRWTRPRVRRRVLAAYVVGSEARGTATPTSDLDIAVVVSPVRGQSALQLSERFHSTVGRPAILWHGRVVDLQFFYPGDPDLAECARIPLVDP
ncbi:MAG: nucleotidyltransferase domain-containing protein [Chloroflexi bacterium]|nr:nucleotidyltransferase domain-containing protein [Chloroflexota bacterium]MBU1747577.1 nucleotidyltransferase domain-containing protein [Chloroflexota bacterium]